MTPDETPDFDGAEMAGGFNQKSAIKLIKNSKAYAWEIKLISLDIDELERLNNKMLEKFGARDGN